MPAQPFLADQLDQPEQQEGGGEQRGRYVGVAEQGEDEADRHAAVAPAGIERRQREQDQHRDAVIARDHRIFVHAEGAEQHQGDRRGTEGRAEDEQRHRRGGDDEGHCRQHLPHRHDRMGAAQQQVPERRMPLAVEDAQHLRHAVAGERDGEGADLVAPEDVARGEEQDEGAPGGVKQDAQRAIGRRNRFAACSLQA